MIAGNTSTRGHRHHRLFFSVPSDFIDNMEGIRHYLAGTIEGPFTLLVLIKESAQGYDTVPWAAIALGAVDESPHPHARYSSGYGLREGPYKPISLKSGFLLYRLGYGIREYSLIP